jgi:hypothetical protein
MLYIDVKTMKIKKYRKGEKKAMQQKRNANGILKNAGNFYT